MADNKRRFLWLPPVGDGLLLLCAMMGYAGSFLSLYGDPNAGLRKATALDRCAANGDMLLACAALFGLATLAVWSLPRFRSAAAGGLTALWTIGVLWNRTEVAQGVGVTVRDVTTLFADRVYWGKAFSYDTGLLSAQEAAAAQLFLLFLLSGLALLLGWAVVRSRRWWLVILLTLPPLLPGLLADLYPSWPAFMALAACWCAMLLASLCRRAAPDGRGKLTLIMLPAAALTLALITVLFPREGYTRPVWALRAQSDLLSFSSRLSEYLPRWENGPFQSTVTYVGATEEADLAHAGPLNYTGRTVLRVNSDYTGWMYLRGSSLAVYEGGVWKALPDGTYESYWSGHEPEISPLYYPATLEQDSPVYTITVDNVGAVGSCVYAPYFLLPQDAKETGALPVEDAYLARRQGLWTHVMTFVDRYPVDPIASVVDPGISVVDPRISDTIEYQYWYGQTEYTYFGYVYDNYLAVPEDLREILEPHVFSVLIPFLLSHSYIPPTARVQMAELFASYLDSLCQYDAGAPAAPDGTDPVYYFLEESRRGYCMHYASAVTLMLRITGIPARYVSGFAAEVSPGRRVDVPDRAAHAWVEVWIDGFGWYPVEVTPADAFAWMDQAGVQETDEPVRDTPDPTPEPTETPQPTAEPDQPTAALPGNGDMDGPDQASAFSLAALFSVLKWIALAAGVSLFIWSVQFAVKRFRSWRMSGADTNRSALVCYNCMSRLERWGGRMDARAVELAQKARFSQHTLTREELDLLRNMLDRERSRLCAAPRRLPARLLFRYWWGRPRTPAPPEDRPPQEE